MLAARKADRCLVADKLVFVQMRLRTPLSSDAAAELVRISRGAGACLWLRMACRATRGGSTRAC